MKFSPGKHKLAAVFFILVIAFVVVLCALTWGKAMYRTAFIVSHVVPDAPRWFEWGKYEVIVKEEEFVRQNSSATQKVDVYLPQGVKRPAFVILFPGFTPKGADDPRLVNLAKSFAGAGIGVAVPDSDTIRKKTFSVEDIDRIRDTFYFLQKRAYVDPDRIGICGFSVAGSYALLATSKLGDDPLFVLSLGGYFNLGDLIAEVISKKAAYNGLERTWEPDPLPEDVVRSTLIEHVGNEEAEGLLRGNFTFDEAQKYIQSLPQEFLFAIHDLSPSPVLSRIKTRVFLMHDTNDEIIPVENSRKIRDSLPKDIPVSYTEFSIFRHVTPKDFFSVEILKFSWQVLSIVRMLV